MPEEKKPLAAKDQPSNTRRVLEKKYQSAARARSRAVLLARLALTLSIVYLALGVVAGASRISGLSMEPKIESGDVVLFWRTGKVEKGDIVILHTEGGTHMVKRVIAVKGDTVDIDDVTGTLLINGVRASEDYVYTQTYTRENGIAFPVTVQEGEVFVLGDNRAVSKDSREFGTVPTGRIDGKVFFSFRLF